MARDKSTIRFWLRTDRSNKDGSSPIHLIYSIQGQREYFQVPDVKLFPINWNERTHLAVYRDKKEAKRIIDAEWPALNKKLSERLNELDTQLVILQRSFDAKEIDQREFDKEKKKIDIAKTSIQNRLKGWNMGILPLLLSASDVDKINKKLRQMTDEIEEVEEYLSRVNKMEFSSKDVIKRYSETRRPRTKKADPGVSIIDFIDLFTQNCERKEGTKKAYTGLYNHMKDYEQDLKQKFLFQGDASILEGFSQYLTEIKKINNITRAKLLSTLKSLLRFAKQTPYKKNVNPDYFEYKNKRDDRNLEVVALTEEEFLSIYNLDLSNNKLLDESRDIFCFSCATGFRKSDIRQFRREHIGKDNFIRMTAIKGEGKKISVPLNPWSFAILEKYSDKENPLPEFRETLNRYIKEVGKRAGIDASIEKVRMFGTKRIVQVNKKYERLSIHSGRKTFTSISLAKGMPIQELMSFTGHSKYDVVKRYIDISGDQKKASMAKIYGPVNPLKVAK